MMRCGRALLLAMLLLGPGGAAPASAQTSRPEIKRIDIRGNRVFGDGALKGAIANRETHCRAALLKPLCWAGVEAAIDRSYLLPRELPLDALRLQAYYWLRGYRDAAVDTALVRDNGAVEIAFTVTEGDPVLVDSLAFRGLDDLDVPGVLMDLPLTVGDPLSAIQIEAVKDTLVSRLREVGYAHAAAFSGFFIPTGTRAAQVSFDVDPGPLARFGPVFVEWLPGSGGDLDPELDEITVRRMVPFREGGLYRYSQLVDGQRNLYNLEIIRTAQVQTMGDTLALDTIIPIRIRVSEGDLHRVRTGAGWSTADCFSTEAQWASRNFRGGARRLTVRGRVSNILAPQLSSSIVCGQAGVGIYSNVTGQAAVELVQPFVFSPRNSLTANVFVERQSFPEIFVREALGFTLALSRNLGRQATATVSYQPALTWLNAGDVFFCISFLLCTPSDRETFTDKKWLSPVGLSVALNRSNRVLNPTAGYSLALAFEHASKFTASDFSYNRVVGEGTGYVGIGERTVLAARVRGGLVRPAGVELQEGRSLLSHPQKRFYSGGAGSVRGYGENRLGPRVLSVAVNAQGIDRLLEVPEGAMAPICTPQALADATCDVSAVSPSLLGVRPTGGDALMEANVELRFPLLGEDFQGAAFLDAGYVWSRQQTEDQSLRVSLGDLEVTPGIGVRYFSPIGPIRVDVGYRSQGAERLPVLSGAICRIGEPGCTGSAITVRSATGEMVTLDYLRTDDLQRLSTPVLFGGGDTFWRRLQFHFSIGQAF